MNHGYNNSWFPARDHPLSPSRVQQKNRVVLYEKIGPGPHPCHWCGTVLQWRPGEGAIRGALLADHVDGNSRNDDPGNLVPACTRCNTQRTRCKEYPMGPLVRTTVRLPKDLIEAIRVQAQQERRSWNAHVIYLLEVAEAQEREWLEGSSASSS